MLLHVLAEIATADKVLTAEMAGVGLLTTMNAFVSNQIADLGECSLANFT